MEKRALLAAVLSLAVIVLFHYIFVWLYGTPERKRPVKAKRPSVNATETKPKGPKLLSSLKKAKRLSVETDLFEVTVTELGARFLSFKLKGYRKSLNEDSPVDLVSAPPSYGLPVEVYLASDPSLAVRPFEGFKEGDIVLSRDERKTLSFLRRDDGLVFEKTLTFSGKSYLFELKVKVRNETAKTVRDRLLLRVVGAPFSDSTKYVFKGPAYYDGRELEEVKLKEGLKEYSGPVSWVAYEDAYFLTALLPKEPSNYTLTFRRLSAGVDEFILWTQEFSLAPGQEKTFEFLAYFGPKKMETLKEAGRGLPEVLHFGFFDPIAKPLLWCLKLFYGFVGNYGVAIILLTVLIRVVFWPLNHLSYKSMKRMQEIQPLIQRLREKYKDDPQRLNQELMQVYRTYKINPFSGCLPILIQIPVFFALYKVLLQAIELRHAPFFAWINDLSAPDRLYVGFHIPYLGGIPVLTILMGLSMYLQQRLSPTSLDPTQAKIMLIMPVFFTVLFVNFPSGLVLYWLVNNLLSIAQQIATNKILRAR